MSEDKMKVHHTAFMTCCFRAQDPQLSGDPYAHLWVTPQVARWAAVLESVSDREPLAHCLRNRWFLDALTQAHQDTPEMLLVNLGAGFSLYPFLLPDSLHTIEVDLPDIIATKQEQVAHFQSRSALPQRQITWTDADLTDAKDRAKIAHLMAQQREGRRVFVLLEGVLFFLPQASLADLFQWLGSVLIPGDQLGAVSFSAEMDKTAVYARLMDSFVNDFGIPPRAFSRLEDSHYQSLAGFELLRHSDAFSEILNHDPAEAPASHLDMLNEHYYLLTRTNQTT